MNGIDGRMIKGNYFISRRLKVAILLFCASIICQTEVAFAKTGSKNQKSSDSVASKKINLNLNALG